MYALSRGISWVQTPSFFIDWCSGTLMRLSIMTVLLMVQWSHVHEPSLTTWHWWVGLRWLAHWCLKICFEFLRLIDKNYTAIISYDMLARNKRDCLIACSTCCHMIMFNHITLNASEEVAIFVIRLNHVQIISICLHASHKHAPPPSPLDS